MNMPFLAVRAQSAIKAAALSFATILASAASTDALATPLTYDFVTGTAPFPQNSSVAAVSALLTGGVSGSFDFPETGGTIVPNPTGSTEYRSSLKNLSGAVAGFSFSDPNGRTMVGNEITVSGVSGRDFFQLLAERPLGLATMYNLTGFAAAGFTLVNVRMFWVEGVLGAPDFLTSNDLPGAPPPFQRRLALDFVPTADIGCVAGSNGFCSTEAAVFFDGLFVHEHAVPEPGTLALFGAGLAGLGAFRRRRKAKA